MARKTRAYVDTSAMIAFADRSDTYHSLFRRLFGDPPALLTSPLVIAEGHGWFLKRYDRTKALQFLNLIEAIRPLKTASIRAREQRGAESILREFSDQDLTLVDAMGLHLMRERRIKKCWSSDYHLGLTGVPLVIYEY